MAAVTNRPEAQVEQVKPAVKDPILEVRRIVKRAQALDKPAQRYLLEILRAMVGGEG